MNAQSKETDARILIDDQLRAAGWNPADKSQVLTEVSVSGGHHVAEPGAQATVLNTADGDTIPTGRADYVLLDQRGRPLAIIEAKKQAIQPYTAKQQALPYAKQIGAPFIFLTNGELIYFWDYQNDDARIVNSFFSRRDLERLVHMRAERKPLATVPIPDTYLRQGETRTLRPYQKEAMQALDRTVELGKRRFLIELPTGCGKTDLIALYLKRLMQAGQAERVLFLVDRDQLAKQAIEAIQDLLPNYSSYWLKPGIVRQEKQITVCLLQTMISLQSARSVGAMDGADQKKGKTLAELKAEMPRLQTYRKGAGEKIPDWSLLEASVFGTDVSRQMVRISMMNLVLHGIRHARLKRANSLSDMGGLTEDDLRRRYKVILANPPFAGQLPKDSIRADLPTHSKKSELLFLSLMMQHLAPGGRCAVVVPEGLLFGSTGAHVDLRKKLVHDFDLLAVVSLPAGVFKPYAGVKTAVLVFRKPKADFQLKNENSTLPQSAIENRQSSINHVWFYEVRNDGYDPDKIAGGGRVETPSMNDIPDLLAHWKAYKAGGFATPPGLEANTLLPHGSEEPACWWVSREKLADAGYNLGAGQWKPRVAEKTSNEDPRALVAEVLEDYRKVVAGLEKLMTELE